MGKLLVFVSVIALFASVAWARRGGGGRRPGGHGGGGCDGSDGDGSDGNDCGIDGNCINVTLPNILNIGTCLGLALDVCPKNADDLIEGLLKLVTCVVNGVVSNGSGSAALAALGTLLSAILERLGLSLDLLDGLPGLCLGSDRPGCQNLLTPGRFTCLRPIYVSLPSVLNVGGCLDDTALFCEDGRPVTDELVAALINALVCILGNLTGSCGDDLVGGIVCELSNVLDGLLGGLSTVLKVLLETLLGGLLGEVDCD